MFKYQPSTVPIPMAMWKASKAFWPQKKQKICQKKLIYGMLAGEEVRNFTKKSKFLGEKIMKILAINGSPKGVKGCTHIMLSALLEGMNQAGARTEVINLAEHKIKHCMGCLACWLKTPGQCVLKDDMVQILEKVIGADMVIYGTPLYVFTMTGLMKDFFDRSIPLVDPYMEESKEISGVTTHPARYKKRRKKMLLISPCGFPEIKHFEPLVATFKYLAKISGTDYLGEILKPAAPLFNNEHFHKQLEKMKTLLKEAGKQLIEKEKIDQDILNEIQTGWMDPKDYRKWCNEYFKQVLEKQ